MTTAQATPGDLARQVDQATADGYRHHGVTVAPFSPHSVSLAVLALGVTAVFGQFSGFKSAYLGSLVEVAVNAAGLVPAFGAQLACLNAAARLLYALGRESGGHGAEWPSRSPPSPAPLP